MLIRRAVDHGLGLLIERDEGDVCGVSLVYPYAGPKRFYSEIGTMRVTANGLGLQVLLAQFHLFQIRLEEWSRSLPSVFAVVTPATASEYNLETSVGMQEWNPPDDLVTLRKVAGLPFDPAKRVLHAHAEVFQNAQTALRACHHGNAVFTTPKGGETLKIDLGWFAPSLLDANLDEE